MPHPSALKPLVCVYAQSATPDNTRIVETATRLGTALAFGNFAARFAHREGLSGAVAETAQAFGAAITTLGTSVPPGTSEHFTAMMRDARAVVLLSGDRSEEGEFIADAALALANAVNGDGPPVVLAQGVNYGPGPVGRYFNTQIDLGLTEKNPGALRVWTPAMDLAQVIGL